MLTSEPLWSFLQLSSGSVPTSSHVSAYIVFKAGIWFDAWWATDWRNDTHPDRPTGLTSWNKTVPVDVLKQMRVTRIMLLLNDVHK